LEVMKRDICLSCNFDDTALSQILPLLGGRKSDRLLGLARAGNGDLAARFPTLLEQVALDLADSASLLRWLGGADLARFVAGCDSVLLINNAGTMQPVGPLEVQDPAAIARAVALNVAAPLMLAGAVAVAATPAASAAAGAHDLRIVHISSGAGSKGYPGWSVYCASKAALDHHARAAALDHHASAAALDGTPALRICSLAPGVIDTAMQAEIRAASVAQFPQREKFANLKRDGALASPADTAQRLVDYLLSDRFGQAPVADLRQLPV
jgi:benzil reductase ((S)-benzoin forming)